MASEYTIELGGIACKCVLDTTAEMLRKWKANDLPNLVRQGPAALIAAAEQSEAEARRIKTNAVLDENFDLVQSQAVVIWLRNEWYEYDVVIASEDGSVLLGCTTEAHHTFAKLCRAVAADLENEALTMRLALAAGVQDVSYDTVAYGRVKSYRGEAVVRFPSGKTVRAVGHKPTGPASDVTIIRRQGRIEFTEIENEVMA